MANAATAMQHKQTDNEDIIPSALTELTADDDEHVVCSIIVTTYYITRVLFSCF